MALKQVSASVQNDGNYCQLDLRDEVFDGPLMRIETFRCSQPHGQYGVTGAGTSVEHLAGNDHLTSQSNTIFRHVFSVGKIDRPKVTLEIREIFAEDGSCQVRVRDLDPESDSFGRLLIVKAAPDDNDSYHLRYEISHQPKLQRVEVVSPLTAPITELVPGLSDIGASDDRLVSVDLNFKSNPLDGIIRWRATKESTQKFFYTFADNFGHKPLQQWAKNVQTYERMGDFRDKAVHPGTNLTGANRQRASEYILIRPYRMSLITIGRICDPDMAKAGLGLENPESVLSLDPKPGVYSVFLSAFLLNIGIYKLGIDKAHSDYGGIPMKLSPGSRLETGASPIVDSTRLNRTLAELAVAFYVPEAATLAQAGLLRATA